MPIYEYECDKCGLVEVIQKISDSSLEICSKCKSKNFKKIISMSAFHLKGGGWYKTDYTSLGKERKAAKDKETVDNKPNNKKKSADKTVTNKKK